jgi:hypothetical protein
LDRHGEALTARAEAVDIYRELAARDPELYGAEYQRLLGVLRREYDLRGMRDEAVTHDLPGSSAVPPPGGTDVGESGDSVRDE